MNGTEPACYYACPQGDTDDIEAQGFTFDFVIVDQFGAPIEDVPATDFWLVSCDPASSTFLCGGSQVINADSATNELGQTTMSDEGSFGGGPNAPSPPASICADYLAPVVQGLVLEVDCISHTQYCFNIEVRSPDMNGDGIINLVDVGRFSACWPPQPPCECADFNCDGAVNLIDLGRYAAHFGPPGHECQ
jgi:hypothetical protein